MYLLSGMRWLLLICYSFSCFGMIQEDQSPSSFVLLQEIKEKILLEPSRNIEYLNYPRTLNDSDESLKAKHIRIAPVLYMNGGIKRNILRSTQELMVDTSKWLMTNKVFNRIISGNELRFDQSFSGINPYLFCNKTNSQQAVDTSKWLVPYIDKSKWLMLYKDYNTGVTPAPSSYTVDTGKLLTPYIDSNPKFAPVVTSHDSTDVSHKDFGASIGVFSGINRLLFLPKVNVHIVDPGKSVTPCIDKSKWLMLYRDYSTSVTPAPSSHTVDAGKLLTPYIDCNPKFTPVVTSHDSTDVSHKDFGASIGFFSGINRLLFSHKTNLQQAVDPGKSVTPCIDKSKWLMLYRDYNTGVTPTPSSDIVDTGKLFTPCIDYSPEFTPVVASHDSADASPKALGITSRHNQVKRRHKRLFLERFGEVINVYSLKKMRELSDFFSEINRLLFFRKANMHYTNERDGKNVLMGSKDVRKKKDATFKEEPVDEMRKEEENVSIDDYFNIRNRKHIAHTNKSMYQGIQEGVLTVFKEEPGDEVRKEEEDVSIDDYFNIRNRKHIAHTNKSMYQGVQEGVLTVFKEEPGDEVRKEEENVSIDDYFNIRSRKQIAYTNKDIDVSPEREALIESKQGRKEKHVNMNTYFQARINKQFEHISKYMDMNLEEDVLITCEDMRKEKDIDINTGLQKEEDVDINKYSNIRSNKQIGHRSKTINQRAKEGISTVSQEGRKEKDIDINTRRQREKNIHIDKHYNKQIGRIGPKKNINRDRYNKKLFLHQLNEAIKKDKEELNRNNIYSRPFNKYFFKEKRELRNFFSKLDEHPFTCKLKIDQVRNYPHIMNVNNSVLGREFDKSFSKKYPLKSVSFFKLIPKNVIDLKKKGKSMYVIINYAKDHLKELKESLKGNFNSFSGFESFEDVERFCNKRMEMLEKALIIESIDSGSWNRICYSKDVADIVMSFYTPKEQNVIKNFGSVEQFESFLKSSEKDKKYIDLGFVDHYRKYVDIITHGHTDYGPNNSYMYAFVKVASNGFNENRPDMRNLYNYLLNNFDPKDMVAKTDSDKIKKDINIHLFMKDFLSVDEFNEYYTGRFFTNSIPNVIECLTGKGCDTCRAIDHGIKPAFLFQHMLGNIIIKDDCYMFKFVRLVSRFYQSLVDDSNFIIHSLSEVFDAVAEHNPHAVEKHNSRLKGSEEIN